MKRAFWYLVVINILDYLTTAYLVYKQGFIVEANPILLYTMQITGTVLVILGIKLSMLALYAYFMYLLSVYHPNRYKHPMWLWVISTINIAYTFVVLRSIYVIGSTLPM
jgi:hypothetical protein